MNNFIDKSLVYMAVDAIPKDAITELTINADVIEKIPDVPTGYREYEQGRGRIMIIRWQAPAKKQEFSRQEFVVMLDDVPWRITWLEGEWFIERPDISSALPVRIDDPVALALLNLPVFDLVKDDGTVVDER